MTSPPSSKHWFFRAFEAVAGNAPLPEGGVLKANLVVGGLLVAGAFVGLFVAWPGIRMFAAFQAAAGLVLLVAARDVKRYGLRPAPVHRLAGVLLVGFAFAYVAFMGSAVFPSANGPQHFSHAPGVLALLVGYGFRLSAGPNSTDRSAIGVTGLVIGGCLDLSVIAFMIIGFRARA